MSHKLYYAVDEFHRVADPIGILWLIKHSQITPILPIYSSSSVGTRRQSHQQDGFIHQVYQERMRPDDTVIAHLQFHIRHEVIHFEFLSRFFAQVDKQLIQSWINQEPTGQYARRVAFLYEFFTEDKLVVPSNIGGNYVDVLNAKQLVTASDAHIVKNKKWRVNNNIAGTKDFAPMVVKTAAYESAIALDIPSLLDELTNEFGAELLMRASVWITLGESKASFTIEGESKQTKRIERFADFMARNIGQGKNPLLAENLADYQQTLLGKTLLNSFGVRQSPVFIGEVRLGYEEIVHYIAPKFGDVHAQLKGLNAFMQKTQGLSSIMRSAVVAFGFVYIHPLADGNGRMHRFLFNDVLRRDGITKDAVILPISKAIVGSASSLKDYSLVLETISKPLMRALEDDYHFEKQRTEYADGVQSNLVVNEPNVARHVWRFLDLTPHVSYLEELIEQVITTDMQAESRYLQKHDQARDAIKEIIDMPNEYADRIIRSFQQNKGKKSNKLIKEIPQLSDEELYQKLMEAVREVFID